MNYQQIPFAEVKHLIPADAWAAWRNEEHAGEFDEESVLWFGKSVVIEKLNLDAPFDEIEHVFLILVQGDLTVEKYIYNEDMDGATGLIVLGDLQARNMLVWTGSLCDRRFNSGRGVLGGLQPRGLTCARGGQCYCIRRNRRLLRKN